MCEAFVSAWRPEFAEFVPPKGSPHEQLRAIAVAAISGRFLEAEDALAKLEETKLPIEEAAAVRLWENEVAQLRFEWPFGECGNEPRSIAAKQRYIEKTQANFAALGFDKKQPSPGPESKKFDDRRCAWDYQQVVIGGLPTTTAHERMLPFMLSQAKAKNGPQKIQQPSPQQAIDGFVQAFTNAQKWSRDNHCLPPKTWELLEADVRGQIAASKGDTGTARKEFNKGLSLAQTTGAKGAEFLFLIRLGDIAITPFGDIETMGFSLAAEMPIREALSNQWALPQEVALKPDFREAGQYYDRAEKLTRDAQLSACLPNLKMRRAFLDSAENRVQASASGYAEAASAGLQAGAVKQAALALASESFINQNRDDFEKAVELCDVNGSDGGLSALVALVKSVGLRQVVYANDPFRALASLGMAERVFLARSLSYEEIELLFSKGELSLGLGLLDPAVTWIQEAADLLDTATAKLTDNEKASFDTYTRINRFRITNRLVLAINDELRDEVGNDSQMRQWIDKRDSLFRILEPLADENTAKAILAETRQNVQLTDVGVQVARARGLPQLKAAVSEARLCAAESPNGDIFLISLLGTIADDLPEVKPELHKLLEQLHPLSDLQAYNKNIQIPGFDPKIEGAKAQRAQGILSAAVSAALAIEAYDILSDWSKQLDQIAHETADPGTAGMQSALSKMLQAQIAFRKGDAQTASDLFHEILNTPGVLTPVTSPVGTPIYLPLLQQVSTVTRCFALLTESEALQQHSEDALLDSERLRIAEERNKWLHTLFANAQPEMAELAMLVRKAALAGGLSSLEATRKEDLEARLPPRNSKAIQAPIKSDLQEFRNHLPANMSVMTYFIGPTRIIGWKITHAGVQMKILDVTSFELVKLREKMLEGLINQNTEWQQDAVELYRLLLQPFEPFSDNAPLVIVSNPATADIPIEVLGADAGNPLVNRTQIVYAAELGLNKHEVKDTNVPVERAPALVVGINGIGLRQAEAEATTVAKLLKAEPIIGLNATKSHVSEQAPHARWLHLATHSHIDAANPFRSSMELADGGVEAWELLTLASAADTVVLSACSTNSPSGFRTAGLLGNSAALASFAMAAKARWIVGTLWGVHDDTTQALIEKFYREMLVNGTSYPQALQSAKLSMLKEKSPPPTNRWAPIVLLARDPWVVCSGD